MLINQRPVKFNASASSLVVLHFKGPEWRAAPAKVCTTRLNAAANMIKRLLMQLRRACRLESPPPWGLQLWPLKWRQKSTRLSAPNAFTHTLSRHLTPLWWVYVMWVEKYERQGAMTKQLPSPYCFSAQAGPENVLCKILLCEFINFALNGGPNSIKNVHFMGENGTWRNRACLCSSAKHWLYRKG